MGLPTSTIKIWQVEELQILPAAVPKAQLQNAVREKFHDPRFRSLDLTAYLSGRFGLGDLKISLFVPAGKSKAWETLRRLADAEERPSVDGG